MKLLLTYVLALLAVPVLSQTSPSFSDASTHRLAPQNLHYVIVVVVLLVLLLLAWYLFRIDKKISVEEEKNHKRQ